MDLQLSILRFLQELRGPILNSIFLLITISTELPVIVGFTAIMYWCINKRYGQRILFTLIGNINVNIGVKELVKAPRPIGIEGLESLRVETASGYSFPSGHTQTATTFWSSLMIIFKNKYLYIIGTIMMISVGISRLYLGVHWPVDVIFGWIFGIVFTILFSKLFSYVESSKNYNVLALTLVPFAAIAFILKSESFIEVFGLLTGFILGYIIEDKYIQFETTNNKKRINFSNKKNTKIENTATKKIIRFLVGIITLGMLYVGLKLLLSSLGQIVTNDIFMMILEYIKYTLIVFYAVAGVPALFKKFNL